MPQLIFLNAATLDDPSHFAPQVVVWTSKGASWDVVDPNLPSFEVNPPMLDEMTKRG